MHRTTVISFVATIGVAVPAAWHVLGADIRTDGAKLRTFQQSFTFDNTRITLDVDRNLVQTGDKVTATVRAYGPPRQVAIDLAVLESSNYAGERVEQPSTQIDHEKLLLTVLPDGGPARSTTIALGTRPRQRALTDSFRIYITQHGHKPDQTEGDYGAEPDWTGAVESGNAAAIGIIGWSGNSMKMRIVPEGVVTPNAPFVVAVKVVNSTGHVLPHHPYFSLANQINASGFMEAPEEHFTIEQINPDGEDYDYPTVDDEQDQVAVGEELVARFRVTPKGDIGKVIPLVASADVYESQPGPVIAGAMEIVTVSVGEAPPAITAAK
ncbi:MAG: hypothetical protein ABI591_28300 [Kofleriaceae bacterium]